MFSLVAPGQQSPKRRLEVPIQFRGLDYNELCEGLLVMTSTA